MSQEQLVSKIQNYIHKKSIQARIKKSIVQDLVAFIQEEAMKEKVDLLKFQWCVDLLGLQQSCLPELNKLIVQAPKVDWTPIFDMLKKSAPSWGKKAVHLFMIDCANDARFWIHYGKDISDIICNMNHKCKASSSQLAISTLLGAALAYNNRDLIEDLKCICKTSSAPAFTSIGWLASERKVPFWFFCRTDEDMVWALERVKPRDNWVRTDDFRSMVPVLAVWNELKLGKEFSLFKDKWADDLLKLVETDLSPVNVSSMLLFCVNSKDVKRLENDRVKAILIENPFIIENLAYSRPGLLKTTLNWFDKNQKNTFVNHETVIDNEKCSLWDLMLAGGSGQWVPGVTLSVEQWGKALALIPKEKRNDFTTYKGICRYIKIGGVIRNKMIKQQDGYITQFFSAHTLGMGDGSTDAAFSKLWPVFVLLGYSNENKMKQAAGNLKKSLSQFMANASFGKVRKWCFEKRFWSGLSNFYRINAWFDLSGFKTKSRGVIKVNTKAHERAYLIDIIQGLCTKTSFDDVSSYGLKEMLLENHKEYRWLECRLENILKHDPKMARQKVEEIMNDAFFVKLIKNSLGFDPEKALEKVRIDVINVAEKIYLGAIAKETMETNTIKLKRKAL